MKFPSSYAEQQEKKRKFISVGVTFGLYSLTLAVGIVLGILNPSEQVYSNTTVILNLEGPETAKLGLGSVSPAEKGEETPEPEAPAPAKTSTESAKIEVAPKTKTETKAVEKTSPESAPLTPAPKTTTSAQAPELTPSTAPTPGAASAPPVETVPAEPWVPGERGPGSRISATNSSVLVPGQGEIPWSKGNSVTIRKAEKGNSVETTLGGAQGTVGHNIYSPVYYSFPLPRTVPASIYNAIPNLVQPPNTIIYTAQARKKAFTIYYEFDGSAYRLKNEVPLDQREPLWQILEEAGYDAADADYKQGRTLMPVVIGFTVTRDNQLRGVEVLQSSGDPEVDKSVLYGFKRAAFWNKTGETVPGRFTYRF
jgi:TonB family protein